MNEASTVIPPTPGRVVWYYPDSRGAESGFARHPTPGEPLAAIIARVWSDNCVNLSVFDANGTAHSRTSVRLVQDAAIDSDSIGAYCTWMPYQKGQAQKAAETKEPVGEPLNRSHRQDLELSVASAVVIAATTGGNAEAGEKARKALDSLLGQAPKVESMTELMQRMEKEASRPNRAAIVRSRVCGVDCQPGGEHCNNYCGRDGSQPMSNAPATYEVPTMSFGVALELLKGGRKVSRTGWNGKGLFLYYVPPASYPAQTGAAKATFGEDALVPYNAYIALAGKDVPVSTWAPSINDCLADDWVQVE